MQTIILDNQLFNHRELRTYVKQVYNTLELLEDEYPDFKNWFFNQVSPELISQRKILIKQYKKEIVGISILKANSNENKICTFRVIDKFQGIGVGTAMMFESLKILNTKNPKITVSELRLNQFSKLLKNFDFNLNSIYQDYYKIGVKEYSFNGLIEEITPHNKGSYVMRGEVVK